MERVNARTLRLLGTVRLPDAVEEDADAAAEVLDDGEGVADDGAIVVKDYRYKIVRR